MLVLASTSPRRRAMLTQLGVTFRVETADVNECRLKGESPDDMTVRLALLKAQTVFDRVITEGAERTERAGGNRDMSGEPAAVLGGDTVVAIGDEVFGKPGRREQALAMLQRLSGKTHTVFSAVAVVAEGHQHAAPRTLYRLSETEVTFARLDLRQLERYCDSAEPFDKAGAYAIQGAGGAFVKHIHGSYSGVVGLPLWETAQLLRELDQT